MGGREGLAVVSETPEQLAWRARKASFVPTPQIIHPEQNGQKSFVTSG